MVWLHFCWTPEKAISEYLITVSDLRQAPYLVFFFTYNWSLFHTQFWKQQCVLHFESSSTLTKLTNLHNCIHGTLRNKCRRIQRFTYSGHLVCLCVCVCLCVYMYVCVSVCVFVVMCVSCITGLSFYCYFSYIIYIQNMNFLIWNKCLWIVGQIAQLAGNLPGQYYFPFNVIFVLPFCKLIFQIIFFPFFLVF